MQSLRRCSRPLCQQAAVSTLTYVYSDSTLVLGPLATHPEPHCYDLCPQHAARVVPPVGWDIVRLDSESVNSTPSARDLELLAEAVRRAATASLPVAEPSVGNRRGHLSVVPDGD